jgi:hypothetical protein
MKESDACRQNCDKADVKVRHVTGLKLCKGTLMGDPVRAAVKKPANISISYMFVKRP